MSMQNKKNTLMVCEIHVYSS